VKRKNRTTIQQQGDWEVTRIPKLEVSVNTSLIKCDIEWRNTLVEEAGTICERKLLERITSLKQCGGCLTITKTEDNILIHIFPVSTDFKKIFNRTEPTVCALFCYECAIRKISTESHREVAKIKQPWMLVEHLKTHNKKKKYLHGLQSSWTDRPIIFREE